MKILIITDAFPYPPISGTPLRVYNLIKNIAQSHDVWLLSFISNEEERDGVMELEKLCREVYPIEKPHLGALARPLDFFRFLLAGIPPDLRLHEVPAMQQKVAELVNDFDIEIVEIVDSYMARYIEDIPSNKNVKTALTFIDVVYSKYLRIARREKKLLRKLRLYLHSIMMRFWEPAFAGKFDRCITVSPADKALLLSKNPNLIIDVIPNGVDAQKIELLPLEEESSSLIYVGNMGYFPNVDAVDFFVNEVLPGIHKLAPDLHFWIVGINPANRVQALAGDQIHVTGRVDDLRPYYSQSRIVVVPLRAGGGTRLKILEAMAFGRPVVSTQIGSEGLDVKDGIHLLFADTHEQFVSEINRLTGDSELQRSLIKNARKLVEESYDWPVIASKLLETYQTISAI